MKKNHITSSGYLSYLNAIEIMADNFFVVRLRAIASQQGAVSWLNVLTSTRAYMQPLLAVSPSPHPPCFLQGFR